MRTSLHAPDSVPGLAWSWRWLAYVKPQCLIVSTRGGNRMRESCTYGSVRGREATRVPTATQTSQLPTRMSDVNSRQTRSKEATMPNETTNEDGVRGNVSRRNFFMRFGVAGAAAATTGPVPAAAQTPAMATEV